MILKIIKKIYPVEHSQDWYTVLTFRRTGFSTYVITCWLAFGDRHKSTTWKTSSLTPKSLQKACEYLKLDVVKQFKLTVLELMKAKAYDN